MKKQVFEKLWKSRKMILSDQGKGRAYALVSFDKSSMEKDVIPGTPFRKFEAVPQSRPSPRKQNTSQDFDSYRDTLFDYPLIVKPGIPAGSPFPSRIPASVSPRKTLKKSLNRYLPAKPKASAWVWPSAKPSLRGTAAASRYKARKTKAQPLQ